MNVLNGIRALLEGICRMLLGLCFFAAIAIALFVGALYVQLPESAPSFRRGNIANGSNISLGQKVLIEGILYTADSHTETRYGICRITYELADSRLVFESVPFQPQWQVLGLYENEDPDLVTTSTR